MRLISRNKEDIQRRYNSQTKRDIYNLYIEEISQCESPPKS